MDGENSGRMLNDSGPGRAGKVLSIAAVCLATAVPILMGVRPISINEDLGYHLALGDEFLATGKISDTSPYVYTKDPSFLYKPGPEDSGLDRKSYLTKHYPPGPGCWYDRDGVYHFVMASWISQIVMSLVNRLAGFDGLCVLSILLIAGIIIQILVLMRRIAMPAALQAAAMLIIGVTAYERFNLRPELLGYNIFIGQLLILVFALGLGGEPEKPISRRAAAAVVVLQLLFTNVHANSSLGFGPSLAFLADGAIRYFWRRFARRGGEKELAARSNLKRLAAMLAIQIAVSFVNPWTWRLAVQLPYEQLAVFRELKEKSFVYDPKGHPWATIGEHFSPFNMKAFGNAKSTYALMGVLGLSGLGMVCSLAGRQWRMFFILFGMAAAATSLRRQIAVAAFILTPVSLYSIWLGAKAAAARFRLPAFARVSKICPCAIAVISAGLVWSVVTSRFYHSEDMIARFGVGASRSMMTMGAADWINRHKPADRIWADFNISSNVYYLTKPHRDVPILTNGWAYPPAVMNKLLNLTQGLIPFEQAAAEYDLNLVALHMYPATQKLARALRSDPRWTVVYIDAQDVIFLRNSGPNEALAREHGITEESFNAREYIGRILPEDRFPDCMMRTGTATLYNLGWFSAVIEVGQATLEIDPLRHETWHVVGASYATRGTKRLIEGTVWQNKKNHTEAGECFRRARQDLLKAGECFRKALEIRPGFKDATNDLEFLNRQLDALDKGLPPLVPSNFDYFPPGFVVMQKMPDDAPKAP
ncbi:MAG: hypothetical protein HZA50_05210 [Planctomycetes bacterium]|nr:hypothetical protein [Planctomycetota bacterium]